ncbi:MAG: sterol desaturase family protein [Myxococcales bacterium]|nr:sterol desaturase family protein [Myxococcales bacterium]
MSSGIVARAAYPAIVVSSVVVADVLRVRGVSPGLVVTVTFLLVLAAVGLLERMAPRDRAWNPPWSEARQDGVYLALAALLQPVGRLLGHALAASAALALPNEGPTRLPLAIQVVLAVTLADLGKYWLHRLAHEHPWLFRFHAEHHAPTRMYSLNGVRLHPVNLLWNLGIDAAVPLLLGLVNYGSTLVVWDVVFGTRRLPAGNPRALGLAEGAAHPSELRAQLLFPLCHDRLDRCSLLCRARR